MSRELVEEQRQGRLEFYKSHDVNNKGKPHSETTKKRISDAMKLWWKERKPIHKR
ncbi:MAG: hypothetical protein ACRD8W_07760 [Nitrososphaeraceae archaeon]